MQTLNIREYKSGDKAAAIEIIQLNTPKYFAAHEEAEFDEFLDNKVEKYYTVESDEGIIGCAGMNFTEDKKEAFLSWGMIHPDFQNKGIGTKLTIHRLDVLKGMAEVELITLKTSQKTYKFYEKLGFHVTETKKDFWAKGLDLVQMVYDKAENH